VNTFAQVHSVARLFIIQVVRATRFNRNWRIGGLWYR